MKAENVTHKDMTEKQWLACGDPIRMMWFVRRRCNATGKQLKLIDNYCYDNLDCNIVAIDVASELSADTDTKTCNAIRDIFGNPFRHINKCQFCTREATCFGTYEGYSCGVCCGHGNEDCEPVVYSWLTPTIRDLARQVRDRVCFYCMGKAHDTDKIYHPAMPFIPISVKVEDCYYCKGTGHADRWELLPIIADALDENGCDCEELLQHLRGWERCWMCLGKGRWDKSLSRKHDVWEIIVCKPCDGTGWIKRQHEHVNGCWAIELLAGEK